MIAGRIIVLVGVLVGAWVAPARAERAAAAGDTLKVWQSMLAGTGFKYRLGLEEGDVGFGGSRVKQILRDHPAALREAKIFGRYQAPSFFGTLVSGAVVGAGIAGRDPEWIYAGIATLLVSFALDQVGYGHLKKAARIYNEGRTPHDP